MIYEKEMNKLIKMYNELWDGNINQDYRKIRGINGCHFNISDGMINMFVVFFNTEYKWFESMKWNNIDDDDYVPTNEGGTLSSTPRRVIEWNRRECAGKTIKQIIKYCNENTEEQSNE